PLGATAECRQVLVAAGRAGPRRDRFGRAVVADQPIARYAEPRLVGAADTMQHAVGVAMLALGQPAAGVAGDHRGVATSVQEYQRLLATGDGFPDRVDRRVGQSMLEPGAAQRQDADRG